MYVFFIRDLFLFFVLYTCFEVDMNRQAERTRNNESNLLDEYCKDKEEGKE